MRFLPTLLLAFRLLHTVQARGDFVCGSVDEADPLKVDGDFDSVSVEAICDCLDGVLAAKTIHWHVYAIPDGEVPRISMFPKKLVQPSVKSSSLTFNLNRDALKRLSPGDETKAGVNLFIPASQMKTITVGGDNDVVEIVNNLKANELPSLNVKDSGHDNQVYITSPNAQVDFSASGNDSLAKINAGSDSTLSLYGENQDVSIKTITGLHLTMKGSDQQVLIEGDPGRISMKGSKGKVFVNGGDGCSGSDTSSTNKCSISDKNVTFDELSCLSSTEVERVSCGCSAAAFRANQSSSLSLGAVIGIVLGVVVFLGAISGIALYAYQNRSTFENRTRSQGRPPREINTETKPADSCSIASDPTTEADVIEAENVSDSDLEKAEGAANATDDEKKQQNPTSEAEVTEAEKVSDSEDEKAQGAEDDTNVQPQQDPPTEAEETPVENVTDSVLDKAQGTENDSDDEKPQQDPTFAAEVTEAENVIDIDDAKVQGAEDDTNVQPQQEPTTEAEAAEVETVTDSHLEKPEGVEKDRDDEKPQQEPTTEAEATEAENVSDSNDEKPKEVENDTDDEKPQQEPTAEAEVTEAENSTDSNDETAKAAETDVDNEKPHQEPTTEAKVTEAKNVTDSDLEKAQEVVNDRDDEKAQQVEEESDDAKKTEFENNIVKVLSEEEDV